MGPSSRGVSPAACGLIASTLLAVAATGGGPPAPRPVRRHPWTPRLEVSVHTVAGPRATVDLEIRNVSGEAVDSPIVATLWLKPPTQPDGSEPPASSTLSAAIDPLTGGGTDEPRGETQLKLPIRGSLRVRVYLEKLGWSLSPPLYVWVPRPLSQVADYPEYELSLHVMAEGRPVQSKPVRLRLRHP